MAYAGQRGGEPEVKGWLIGCAAGWRLVRREKWGKVDCRVRPLQHSSTVTQRHCVEYLCVEYLQDFRCANVERIPKFLESAIRKEKTTGENKA